MSNAVKNLNQSHAQPFIHVPKVDKATGQPIPQWKQQVMLTKIAKRVEQEQMAQSQVNHLKASNHSIFQRNSSSA